MIKAILFDYGGVLGNDSDAWEKEFVEIPLLTGLSPQKLSSIFEKHWPMLKIGSESVLSFWKDVSNQAPHKTTSTTLNHAYLTHISINNCVLSFAKDLKKSFITGILSNETKQWMNAKIKIFSLRKVFNPIYCSAMVGIAKPDHRLFLHVLSDLSLNPNEITLIDNQTKNIEVASGLGFHTILYQNPAQLKKDLVSLLDRNHPSLNFSKRRFQKRP